MYKEDDYIMISALQHFLFCPRQCALIHLEQEWSENYLTTSGNLLHKKVNEGASESRKNIHIARSLRLFSSELGISGISDVVEFYRKNDPDESCCRLENKVGWWQPYPVEYKRGKTKNDETDEVQLCAQAICLEEMLKVKIKSGSLYYGSENRRHEVIFTQELRSLTKTISEKVHKLINNKLTPKAEYSKKCMACSMYDVCIPEKDHKKDIGYLKLIYGEDD